MIAALLSGRWTAPSRSPSRRATFGSLWTKAHPWRSSWRRPRSRESARRYVRELLTAFGRARTRKPIRQALIEPLSERELDVLRLLATDLDGPAIASELVVSLSTIRSHTEEHLRQARREQPSGSGPPRRGTRPHVASRPPTAAHQRSRLVRTRAAGSGADSPAHSGPALLGRLLNGSHAVGDLPQPVGRLVVAGERDLGPSARP